jgi:Protein of unknown function (DUF3485)
MRIVMLRTLPYMIALAIIISSGIVHGLWTGRFQASRELETRAARLERVPLTIGDWKGRALTLDRRTVESAGIAGYLMRRYEDRQGHAVTVLLVCGRPGPIAVHTPEVCYPGTGYEQTAPTAKLSLGPGPSGQPDESWVAEFDKPGAILPKHLRILYTWSADGTRWAASGNPRLQYAGEPALYKLYVVQETAQAEPALRDGPGATFARQLLPELRKALSGGQSS